ncbi:MAG TPA: hypothetical protein VH986_06580, partial [Acidimicrobiia bacterium]
MRRTALVLATVLITGGVVVVPSPARSASGTSRAGTQLLDGFNVVNGTRLLGAVNPSPPVPPSTESARWTALLWVDTDAATVLRSYARQAMR